MRGKRASQGKRLGRDHLNRLFYMRQSTPPQADADAVGGGAQPAGDGKRSRLGWEKMLDEVKKGRVVVVTNTGDIR